MEKISFNTWDDFIKALIPSCFSGFKKEIEIDKDLENFKHKKIEIKDISNINFGEKFRKNQYSLQALYRDYNYYKFKNKLESFEITFLKSVKIRNTNDIDFPKSIFEETLEINTDTNIKFKYSEFHGDVIILGKNQDGFKIEFLNCVLNKFSNIRFQSQDKAFGEYSFFYSFVKDIQLLSPKNFKYIVHREDNENKDRKISLYLNSKGTEKILIASDIDKVSLGELKIFNNSDENININISNLNIQSVELKNGFFVNKFILTNVSTDKFDIINCNLGQTTFNGVEINKLYLENATLNDCIFNGVEFPKDYKLEEGELKPKKLKDNYRQLKFVMDKNGNHTEANKFYEKEMSYLLKELHKKDTFEWKKLLKLDFYFFEAETLSQKLVLFISRILNGFGNNWILSFFWLFLLGFSASYISSLFNGSKLLPKINDLGNSLYVSNNISNNLYLNSFFTFLSIWIILFTSGLVVKLIEKLMDKIGFLIFGLLIGIMFLMDTSFIHTFLQFIFNPLYGLDSESLKNPTKSSLQLFGLGIYKILYGIILWHLLVALKRTTKR